MSNLRTNSKTDNDYPDSSGSAINEVNQRNRKKQIQEIIDNDSLDLLSTIDELEKWTDTYDDIEEIIEQKFTELEILSASVSLAVSVLRNRKKLKQLEEKEKNIHSMYHSKLNDFFQKHININSSEAFYYSANLIRELRDLFNKEFTTFKN